MFGRKTRLPKAGAGVKSLNCSFCNKSQKQVRKLIAGPNVYICDECVDICQQIVNQEPAIDPRSDSASVAAACSLCKVTLPLSEALVLPGGRGLLCPACASAVGDAVPPPSQQPN
jgi:hypothetical protein